MNTTIQSPSIPRLVSSLRRRRTNQGITVTELLVASMLLAIALGAVQSIWQRTIEAQLIMARSCLIDQLLANQRAEIASWPPDQVTEERLGGLTIPQYAQTDLPEAKWQAEVVDQSSPVNSKRVFIALKYVHNGQPQTSRGLSFWVCQAPN